MLLPKVFSQRPYRPCLVHKRQTVTHGLARQWETFTKKLSAAPCRSELLSRLQGGSPPDTEHILSLVEQLAALRLPIEEAKLGGGLWVLRFFKGAAPWQFWAAPAKLLGLSGTQVGQDLDPATKRVINYAEITGPDVYVTASGSFRAQDVTAGVYQANIEGGALHINGAVIPLGFIRGSGNFTIKYLDDDIRIFESDGGTLAVQVKQSALSTSP